MLLSAMILKAAAYCETTGPGRDRPWGDWHCLDFAALAAILAARDTVAFELKRKDRQRLRKMIEATLTIPVAVAENPGAERRLRRLSAAIEAR